MSLADLRREFRAFRDLTGIKQFLGNAALRHTGGYYHYTTLGNLKNMLKSKMLYLSLGRTMNDLREPLKCNPEKWKRLYVLSFSYSGIESMAMWNIYGNPLNEVLRIEFSPANIHNLVLGKELEIFQIGDSGYFPLCKAAQFSLFDIAYVQDNNKSIVWNQASIRKGVQPQYLWQYDPSENAYTLFLCHDDLQPEYVLQIVHRLWYGSYPIQTINSIHVDQYNFSDTVMCLSQAIPSNSAIIPFHQHRYGYSRSI